MQYREHQKQRTFQRQADNDLSVQIVGDPNAEFPTVITKINMPFLFARRAMINTYYSRVEPGSKTVVTVNSSIMNEQLLHEAQTEKASSTRKSGRALINDEVMAFNHINYVRVSPSSVTMKGASGAPQPWCKWTSVYCLDVSGMVKLDFIKTLEES